MTETKTLNATDLWDQPKDLSNLFTAEDRDQEIIADLLVQSSYFIPTSVLGQPKYRISPMYSVPQRNLSQVIIALEAAGFELSIDTGMRLLIFARFVGLSMRKNTLTGKRYAVLKVWYGAPSSTDTAVQDAELTKILSFIRKHGVPS